MPLWRWMIVGLSLGLLACASVPPAPAAPSPLPLLGPLSTAARAQLLQARTSGVETLSAVLAVSYTLGPQRGTFDLVVNYAATPTLRFTALRDSLLQTQVLFDVLLTPTTYQLLAPEETGPQLHQGPVAEFGRAYPSFRTFFIVGEAFFFPGLAKTGTARAFNTAGTRLRTILPSGVHVAWQAHPDTLEITRGCFTWTPEEETVRVQVHYQDYRPVGATYLPHRVLIRDPRVQFTADSVVKLLSLNEPLAPGVFELTP